MGDYRAGSITENDVTVPIYVDDQGHWKAEHSGRSLSASTRDELKKKIKTATKRTTRKVAVPFIHVEKQGEAGIRFWRGTATGLHSGNGNVLYERTLRGEPVKDQFTSWGSSSRVVLGDVPDHVLALYHQIVKDYSGALAALQDFERKYKLDLKDAVTKALDEAE